MAYEAAMRLIMRLANQTALVMTIAFDGVKDGRVVGGAFERVGADVGEVGEVVVVD